MNRIAISTNQTIRLGVVFALMLILFFMPNEWLFDTTHSVCVHSYLFGFECPLCGMTRAVYEFEHFRFLSAIKFNFVVVLLPMFLVFDIISVFNKQKWVTNMRKVIVMLIFAGLAAIYLYRTATHFGWF